jgi:PAS domain S-box-containing protein
MLQNDEFRRYFELGLIGMAITSPAKGIIEVNDKLCEILGYPREELLQRRWSQLTHPDDLAADYALFDRVLRGESDGYSLDKRWIRKDGRVIDGTISVKCVRNEDGSVAHFMALLQDVTERNEAQAELKCAHDELEARVARRTQELHEAHGTVDLLLDSIPDRFFAVDRDWRCTYFSKHAERQLRLLGKDPASFIGKVLWDEFADSPAEHIFRQVMYDRAPAVHEHYYAPLGEWVENRIYPSLDGGVAIFQRYVTERKNAEEERAQLLRRVMTAHEEERRRLSREMHDQFGQQLSALNLKVGLLKRACVGVPGMRDQLEALEDIARQLDADVDYMAWNLRPTALDDLGLVVALSTFVTKWTEHYGIPAELHTRGMQTDRLSGEAETALYRILQEALTNVAKHAAARNVDVILGREANHVSLIVEDDGKGFDPAQAFAAKGNGLGLIGMRERASLLGGTVEIESEAGHGATVAIRIPVTA